MVHNQLSNMLTEVIQAEVYWKENINFEYLPQMNISVRFMKC